MTTTAHIRIALITTVCAAQFFVSASDIIDQALHVTHSIARAAAFPACIDATILIAALTVAARTGVNKKARQWAAFARYFGFTATVYANVISSGITRAAHLTPDLVASAAFMLIPAVALIATMELLIHGAQGTPATRKAASAKTTSRATVTRLRAA